MADEQDLQTPPADSPPTSAGSGDGQSQPDVNWEKRFKGLQAKYNQDIEMLRQDIQGKEAFSTQTVQARKELEAQLSQLQVAAEQQRAELAANLETVNSTLSAKDEELATLRTALDTRDRRDKIRKTLAGDHQDLIGWFESGHLKPFNDDGSPLDGEALTENLNGFRQMLAQTAQTAFQSAMDGATPPQFSTAPTALAGMQSVEQMQAWLTANPDHPEFAQVEEAHLAAVEKQMGNYLTPDPDYR